MSNKPGSLPSPVVLVVEDNGANMRLVCDLLAAYGITALKACDSESAFKIISEKQPDLILMDISLKGMNGLSITRVLKQNPATNRIPVIILTAHAMEHDEENAWKAGCDGFIPKPISIGSFMQQIDRFLPADFIGVN